MPDSRLIAVHRPRRPDAVVLLLHGGASRAASVRVSPTQASVLRIIPIAHRVARTGGGRLAVFRLLNSTRGWDARHTPVDDTRWALAEIGRRWPDLPVGLIGHSLGGRAALLAGSAPAVRSIVALAPWVHATDPAQLEGRRTLIVHGSADHIALPSRSRALADRLRATTDVGYICIDGGKHAMLRHWRAFDGYAAAFTTAVLLPDRSLRLPEPVREVLAGAPAVPA